MVDISLQQVKEGLQRKEGKKSKRMKPPRPSSSRNHRTWLECKFSDCLTSDGDLDRLEASALSARLHSPSLQLAAILALFSYLLCSQGICEVEAQA